MSISLLDLSPEILHHVLEYLCGHCSGRSVATELWMQSYRTGGPDGTFRDLYNLSLTCKAIRNVTLPVLHHGPVLYQFRNLNTARLVQNIIQSPHLAAAVREIDFRPSDSYSSDLDYEHGLSKEQVSLFEEEMRSHAVDEKGQPFVIRCRWQDESDWDCSPDEYLRLLFLAKARNLQRLFTITLESYLCPKLTFLHLTFLGLRHWEQGEGFEMRMILDFLKAAPALQMFHGIHCVGADLWEGHVYHENVTEVMLTESALSENGLSSIMRGFPKLSTFTYSTENCFVGDGDYASPLEIAEALFIRSDTLIYADINMNGREGSQEEDNEAIDSLADMERLNFLMWEAFREARWFQRPHWRSESSD